MEKEGGMCGGVPWGEAWGWISAQGGKTKKERERRSSDQQKTLGPHRAFRLLSFLSVPRVMKGQLTEP